MKASDVVPRVAWTVFACAGAVSSVEFDVARSAGLGPVCAGAVALVADLRTLDGLSRKYGSQIALWGSVALGSVTGTVALLSHNGAVPVTVSAGVALITHTLNRDEES